MLSIRLLRESPETVRNDLRRRGRDPQVVDDVVALDTSWRQGLEQLNALRATRNQVARDVATAKKSGNDASDALAQMKQVSQRLKRLEDEVPRLEAERDTLLRSIPNVMHPDVPPGKDDSENVQVRAWGGTPRHAFEAVSHVDLLERLDLADLERAARAAGSRFYYLKGDLVLMARALEMHALRMLHERGYIPIEPPFMVRREALEGVIDLSDFEDVVYRVEAGKGAARGDATELYLIATSEHPLAAYHMDEILPSGDLPLRYAGISPCFRKEAGAHGKDTKGIFRVHQFTKVEQFVYATAEQSADVHAELVQNAEDLLQSLGIPYRVVDICTGDLGTVAARKFDLEAWMPVQGAYREVVSASNCTDYQARGTNTRHRVHPGDPTEFVHTLNATALAVERILVAILENFQQEDGSVTVPEALRPYLGGRARIEAKQTQAQDSVDAPDPSA